MQTSATGRAALELEEGVVLRAYRDSVGVWTIGAGLTAASGVVKPVAGMVITRAQADEMLAEALKRYEREVEIAMCTTDPSVVRPSQHAFDAGVSFHWNTGGIGRAGWVKLWKAKADRGSIWSSLTSWAKAGDKVLPALKSRRDREFRMLMDGVYRTPAPDAEPHPIYARWALALSADETRAVFDGLRVLGYDPGVGRDRVWLSAVLAFQKDHGLTVDGIIGRATLSTMQRRLDKRAKGMLPVAAIAASLVGGATGLTDRVTQLPQADAASLTIAGLWMVGHLWGYRDAVAAVINPTLPRFAAFLRSF